MCRTDEYRAVTEMSPMADIFGALVGIDGAQWAHLTLRLRLRNVRHGAHSGHRLGGRGQGVPHRASVIAAAACALPESSRCPYTSAVTRIDEWPSSSEISFSSTPCAIKIDAAE